MSILLLVALAPLHVCVCTFLLDTIHQAINEFLVVPSEGRLIFVLCLAVIGLEHVQSVCVCRGAAYTECVQGHCVCAGPVCVQGHCIY
jgi:hypothetical protein